MNLAKSIPWCLVAFALIGTFAGSQYVKIKKTHLKDLDQSYNQDPDIQQAYARIVKERAHIFSRSILIGLVVSAVATYRLYYTSKHPIHEKLGSIICFFVATTLFITYVGYQLSPKSDYMLNHMTHKNQIKEWLNVYRSFQVANYIGMILGIGIYILYQSIKE